VKIVKNAQIDVKYAIIGINSQMEIV